MKINPIESALKENAQMALPTLVTRRRFLASGSAALLGGLTILSRVHGQTPANDAIGVGIIGIGKQGALRLRSFLQAKGAWIVAICDVRADNLAQARAICEEAGLNGVAEYREHEALLARSDIDAVCIVTGGHWHTPLAIQAMRAGKDVYLEKPVSVCMEEDEQLLAVARETGRVFQAGTQRASVLTFATAAQMAREGKLGTPKAFYAMHNIRNFTGLMRPESVKATGPIPDPQTVLWDRWMGPAPAISYNETMFAYASARQNILGYGHPIGDWCSHTFDLCLRARGIGAEPPLEYVYENGSVIGRYADGLEIRFEAPPNYQARDAIGVRFEGSEGWIYVCDAGRFEGEPKSLLRAFFEMRRAHWAKLVNWEDHVQDFLNCVRSRKETVANALHSRNTMFAPHMVALALQSRTSLRWDPANGLYPAIPGADVWLRRDYRQPWGGQL